MHRSIRPSVFFLIPFLASNLWAQDPEWQRSERRLRIAHYQTVESELAVADRGHLGAAQRTGRRRILELLAEYRTAADFGRNEIFPGERLHLFVDAGGRRCAVAYLLDHTDHGAITDRVAAARNGAFVADLAGDPEFLAWLSRFGLTLEEAARIQAPGSGAPPPWLRTPPDPAVVGTPVTPGPSRPGVPGPAGRPAPPVDPAHPPAITPRGVALSEMDQQTWTEWWGWNRLHYLKPQVLPVPSAVAPSGTVVDPRAGVGDRVEPLLTKGLDHDHAAVRAAAALASARIRGPEAVEGLTPLLRDPNQRVRFVTFLALGASGSTSALHNLMHLAEDGTEVGSRTSISYLAQPLAVLGLALAGRNGVEIATDDFVAGLMTDLRPQDEPTLGAAVMLYQRLVHSDRLVEPARAQSRVKGADPVLRSRALESMTGNDKESLAHLLKALGDRRLQARRSAAMALAEVDGKLALGPLMTAYELEREYLTRGLLLLSIGMQGGDKARAFLLKQVTSGRKTMRAWAALSLGLLTRAQPDATVADAVRRAYGKERNRENVGAYLVAMGLGRDAGALQVLAEALAENSNSIVRASAAEGLALLGGVQVLGPLREALPEDPCPFTRAAIAEALGFVGEPADAARLLAALERDSDPQFQDRIASALGKLGCGEALAGLVELLSRKSLPASLRAAGYRALGTLLARNPERTMVALSRNANFSTFPDWLRWVLSQDV